MLLDREKMFEDEAYEFYKWRKLREKVCERFPNDDDQITLEELKEMMHKTVLDLCHREFEAFLSRVQRPRTISDTADRHCILLRVKRQIIE